MVLSFTSKFPWKSPTYFPWKIKKGIKKHTLRQDKSNRWHAGRAIDAYTGGYKGGQKRQFIGCYDCTSTQQVTLLYYDDPQRELSNMVEDAGSLRQVVVDGRVVFEQTTTGVCQGLEWLRTFAKNDGFDTLKDFHRYFNATTWQGKLIHWTDLTY